MNSIDTVSCTDSSRDFGRETNFLRLVTLLDLLCFSIGLREGGSMLRPTTLPSRYGLATPYESLRLLHQHERVWEADAPYRQVCTLVYGNGQPNRARKGSHAG